MKLWVVLCAFLIIHMVHESNGRPATDEDDNKAVKVPTATPASAFDGIAFDEIVVESSLNVRKKPMPARRRPQRYIHSTKHNAHLTRSKRDHHHHHHHHPQRNSQFNNGFGGVVSNPGFQQQQQQQPNFGNIPASFGVSGGFAAPPNYGSSASTANANSQSQGFGPNGFGSAAAQAQAQGFHAQGPLGGFGASAANTGTQSFQVGPNGLQGSAGQSTSQVYQLPNGHALNLALTNGFSFGPDGRPATSNANSITYTK